MIAIADPAMLFSLHHRDRILPRIVRSWSPPSTATGSTRSSSAHPITRSPSTLDFLPSCTPSSSFGPAPTRSRSSSPPHRSSSSEASDRARACAASRSACACCRRASSTSRKCASASPRRLRIPPCSLHVRRRHGQHTARERLALAAIRSRRARRCSSFRRPTRQGHRQRAARRHAENGHSHRGARHAHAPEPQRPWQPRADSPPAADVGWRQLARSGVPESRLPPGAEVRFPATIPVGAAPNVLILSRAWIGLLQRQLRSLHLLLPSARGGRTAEEAAAASYTAPHRGGGRRARLARGLHAASRSRLARLAVDTRSSERGATARGLAAGIRKNLSSAEQSPRWLLVPGSTPSVPQRPSPRSALRPSCRPRRASTVILRMEVGSRDVRRTCPIEDLALPVPRRAGSTSTRDAVPPRRSGRRWGVAPVAAGGKRLRLTVSDDGVGFDPSRLARPRLPQARQHARGRVRVPARRFRRRGRARDKIRHGRISARVTSPAARHVP